MSNDPVLPVASAARLTVVVTRRIRAGREGEYELAMREFVAWCLAQPGHEGLHVLRPAPGGRDYTVVARFHDEPARRAFTRAPEYARWMERLGLLTEGDPRIQELTGLEGFVSLPEQGLPRPPAWKQAVATFLGVLPTALVLGEVLAPRLAGLPLLVAAALFNGAVVASLTWLVMPLVTRALHRWLFPAEARS
ncbi:MAG TPA: antibiotic biosynthesis monooxygenase [Planctomycetota bacterium]